MHSLIINNFIRFQCRQKKINKLFIHALLKYIRNEFFPHDVHQEAQVRYKKDLAHQDTS